MFGLDDLPWSVEALELSEIENILVELSDLINTIFTRNELLLAHETVYELPRVATLTLMNILFEMPELSVSVRLRAQKLFDRVPTFPDGDFPFDVRWSDNDWIAPTTSRVCFFTQRGEPSACVTSSKSKRYREVFVSSANIATPVWFISDESSHVTFFRNLAKNPHCDEKKFADISLHAFPNIAFVEGVFDGLNDLRISFNQRREEVIHALSILCDNSEFIFYSHKEKEITERLRTFGIDASTENRETLKNLRCRVARQRTINSQVLIFDWHIKFEPHIDRLHFHPPALISNYKPIVGIFHSHLPLPGD